MRLSILVIEDNAANMKLTTLLLEKAGYSVLQAEDAAKGLRLAEECLPQLILMDIHLPGMDGLSATQQLKSNPLTRSIPVVALTALTMKGDAQRIIAAGCDGYIAKPIQYRSFLAEVGRYLACAPSITGGHPHE